MDSGLVNNMKYKKTTAGILGGLTLFGGGTIVDNQINPYEDKGTHYEMGVISDIPQNDRIEIAKDKPSVTLSRWNNEERVTVEPVFNKTQQEIDGKTEATITADRPLFSKKMEFKKGAVTAFVEPKTDTEFDIDFTLDSKPSYNVFEYTITGAEGMDFFYQPALTQKEIDEGFVRPDNVIGSYAVYHKDKKNNCTNCGTALYGTGKLFHIYRPEAIDAGGNRVWAVLDYKNGVLSVTVPQEFLDNAIYPVRVDPTFGYTTAGATLLSAIADATLDRSRMTGNGRTLSATGTVDSVSAYLAANTSTEVVDIFYGIYREDSGGAGTHALVASGQSLNSTITTTKTWKTINFASESLSADDYILGVTGNGEEVAVAYVALYGDTLSTTEKFYNEFSQGAGSYATRIAEDPWTTTVQTSWNCSVYVTYTEAGGGGTSSSAESFWDDI